MINPAATLMTIFKISYGQVAAASGYKISRSGCFNLVKTNTGTPKQKAAFVAGLALCIQQRLANLDSSYVFPVAAMEPAKIEAAIVEEPVKLIA